jgi:hypothetical protein
MPPDTVLRAGTAHKMWSGVPNTDVLKQQYVKNASLGGRGGRGEDVDDVQTAAACAGWWLSAGCGSQGFWMIGFLRPAPITLSVT